MGEQKNRCVEKWVLHACLPTIVCMHTANNAHLVVNYFSGAQGRSTVSYKSAQLYARPDLLPFSYRLG